MQKYRIIIAGGRDFNDYETLKCAANDIIRYQCEINNDIEVEIVSGRARGADRLGERFADEFGYSLAKFPADWDKNGKQAGIIRNRQMAKYATEEGYCGVLIAFWDGESRGTRNMIETAGKFNMEVRVIRY